MSDFVIDKGVLIEYKGTDEEVIIPENVTSIEGGVFRWDTHLKRITIPGNVKNIGYRAFIGCTALESVIIEDGVTTIEYEAFWQCCALKEIMLPKSVVWVGRKAFSDTKVLTKKDGFISVGHVLISYDGESKEVVIPQEYTVIADHALASSWGSKETVKIHAGVTHIGKRAFAGNSNLKKVEIASKRIFIADDAFCSWSNMLKYTREIYAGFAFELLTQHSVISKHMLACEYIKDEQRAEHYFPERRSAYNEWIKKNCVKNAVQWNKEYKVGLNILMTGLEEGFLKTEKAILGLVDVMEQIKLPEDEKKTLDAIRTNAKVLAKAAGDSKAIERLLSGAPAQEQGTPWIIENGVIVGVKGKHQKLFLPQEEMTDDAFAQADVQVIVVPATAKKVILYKLEKMKISEKIREIQLPAELLIGEWKFECVLPEQIAAKIVPINVSAVKKGQGERILRGAKGHGVPLPPVYDALEKRLTKEEMIEFLSMMICEMNRGSMPQTATAGGFCAWKPNTESVKYMEKLGVLLWDKHAPKNLLFQDGTSVPMKAAELALIFLQDDTLRGNQYGGVGCMAMQMIRLLDEASMQTYLRTLLAKLDDGKYRSPMFFLALCARLGNLEMAKEMLALRRKSGMSVYNDTRIEHFIICNENRDVLLLLDKKGLLSSAAWIRGIKESTLREQLLSSVEAALDEQGEAMLDYGSRQFRVKLLPKMVFSILDVAKNKELKTLPKPAKTDDEQKVQQAMEQFKTLKASVKNAADIRLREIKTMFEEGTSITCRAWKKNYAENVISSILAQGILWGVYEKDDTLIKAFRILEDGSAEDVNGAAMKLKTTDRIGVVDGAQLSKDELTAWRTIFAKHALYQPMKQLALPVCLVPQAYIENRYMGCEITAGVLSSVFGYDSYSNETPPVECDYISACALFRHGIGKDTSKICEVTVTQELPAMDQLADHQKRLWNQAVNFMDKYLDPVEYKAKPDICADNAEAVRGWVEQMIITPDNLEEMLNTAIANQAANCTAYLLELKHEWLGDQVDADWWEL